MISDYSDSDSGLYRNWFIEVYHMLFTCCSLVVHMLFTCWSHVGHMLFTCWSQVGHMLFTCCSQVISNYAVSSDLRLSGHAL